MPRDGVIIFRGIVGKLAVLRIICDKCGRSGQYRVDRLITRYGIDAKLFEWSDEPAADCPSKQAMRGLGLAPFWEDQLMSSEVPIEIEDKQTAVSIMREPVEHLQATIEVFKARNRSQ